MEPRDEFEPPLPDGRDSSSGASGDPADQWVFDEALGTYRLLLPGERPPAPHIAPRAEPQERAAAASPAPTAPRPARREPARRGSRSRRRRSEGRRGAPWAIAGVCLLGLAGAGGYLALQGGSGTNTARPSSSASPSCAAPGGPAAHRTTSGVPAGPRARPIDVRVTVLNGSGIFGQAEAVLGWMQNTEGFLRTSNGGPAADTPTTSLVYAPDHADQARALAAAMGLPASALHGTGKGTGARDPMVLTLGKDFKGVGKPLAAAPAQSAPGAGAAACDRTGQ